MLCFPPFSRRIMRPLFYNIFPTILWQHNNIIYNITLGEIWAMTRTLGHYYLTPTVVWLSLFSSYFPIAIYFYISLGVFTESVSFFFFYFSFVYIGCVTTIISYYLAIDSFCSHCNFPVVTLIKNYIILRPKNKKSWITIKISFDLLRSLLINKIQTA